MGKPDNDGDFAMSKSEKGYGGSKGDGWLLLGILFLMLAGFMGLTAMAVWSGSVGDVSQRPKLATTLATISGPFTGAIARNGQGCCLANSTRLAVFLAPVLAVGLAVPICLAGAGALRRGAKIGLWTVGWFLWLAGGPISFLHAFN